MELTIPHKTLSTILNFIDGKFCNPISGHWIDNVQPARGLVYGRIAASDRYDVDSAIAAAQKAFNQWSALSASKRSEHMLTLANLMERDLELLAEIESFDNGKPLHVARNIDIPRSISNIRFFATAILHQSSESYETERGVLNVTLRQPLGVVACISPWNLPLYLFTWKIAPALAAGNTVVAKPSEITPATAFYFSQLCTEAGIPAGVINILHGPGQAIGEPLLSDPRVKAVSFTGGTATGASIASIAAPRFKKMSLELGGKNATLVFADCDFDRTVSETVRAAFSNQGQICLCGSRIYIERSIYERFKMAFVEKVKHLRVGDPSDAQSDIGAVVSKPHLEKVLSYVALAKEEGGTLLCGGNRIDLNGGFFMEPTVFEGLDPYCRTNQEEIFGPVVTLYPFDSEEQAVEFANCTAYGLAFSVWTENLKRAHRLSEQLQAGIVWINCWMLRDLRTPFGGMKQSGVGREGGWDALRFFTESKNVCIKSI
jgi:aminomuconate-semialdehyde/2-hydroxymuconate-6-semialdehyde dehydrogenase